MLQALPPPGLASSPRFRPRSGTGITGILPPPAKLLSQCPLPVISDFLNAAVFSAPAECGMDPRVSWRKIGSPGRSLHRQDLGEGPRLRGSPAFPQGVTVLVSLGKKLPPALGLAFALPASHLSGTHPRPLLAQLRPVASGTPGSAPGWRVKKERASDLQTQSPGPPRG